MITLTISPNIAFKSLTFIDQRGEPVDPLILLGFLSILSPQQYTIKRESQIVPIITRSKDLGARADGIDTLVGYKETAISFSLEINII